MRFRFVFPAIPLVAALLAGACNGESEGMPCDTRAGNGGTDDCASGLVCTSLPNVQGARCCPSDRTTATTPECSLGSSTSDASSPAPPEASTGDGPATGDVSSSGSGEASTDAPPEAAGDAGASSGGDGATE